MISFLVTYYNQQNFVCRSLESILNQKLTENFEILVGDDGSNDKTVEIVQGYISKYPEKIKLFIQPRIEKKKYLSVIRASMNRLNLLSKANGDYVCFLDGDDAYCDFEFIQNSIDLLEKQNEYVGIAHNYVIINNNDKLYNKTITEKKIINLYDYTKSLYFHVGTIIFKWDKKISLDNLFQIHSFDDNNITYFFLNRGNLLYRDIYVYNYFSNENSICASADNLEMKLLNALDYSIQKKIINRNHFTLFIRYFETRYFVFKNRKKIIEDKYQKWKELAVPESFEYKIFNWNNLKKTTKLFIYSSMKLFKFIFILYRLYNYLIEKILGIYKKLRKKY